MYFNQEISITSGFLVEETEALGAGVIDSEEMSKSALHEPPYLTPASLAVGHQKEETKSKQTGNNLY